MYTPASFKMTDQEELFSFIRENSFALVVTSAGSKIHASHLPLELEVIEVPGEKPLLRLIGHFARANDHWRDLLVAHELLVVFSGPHAFVSPKLYQDPDTVPTWNYVAVHVTGRARIVESESELKAMLNRLVALNEGDAEDSWRTNWSNPKVAAMLKAIVGFEIEVDSIEGKKKLSQNRSEEDQRRVRSALPALFNRSPRDSIEKKD